MTRRQQSSDDALVRSSSLNRRNSGGARTDRPDVIFAYADRPPAPGGRQQDPKHSLTGAEVRPLHAPLQGSQLVAEGKILEEDVVVATAGHGDRSQEQQCQFKHVVILSGVALESNTGSVDDNILANDSQRDARSGTEGHHKPK